jgi:hypothetical protein
METLKSERALNFEPGSEQHECVITVLGTLPEQQLRAEVVSVSGRSITVRSDEALPDTGALKLEWAEQIILAEIVTSGRPDNTTVLRIRHALRISDVEEIRRRWV